MNETDLHIRVYPEEKQLIRKRAADHGLTMSDYIRRQVVAEEREAVLKTLYPHENVAHNRKALKATDMA